MEGILRHPVAFVATLSEGENPATPEPFVTQSAVEQRPSLATAVTPSATRVAGQTAPQTAAVSKPMAPAQSSCGPVQRAVQTQPPAQKTASSKPAEEHTGSAPAAKPESQSAEPSPKLPAVAPEPAAPARPARNADQSLKVAGPQTTSRGAETAVPDKIAPQTREFVLQLPSGMEKRVEVHLFECAGRVRVTVRSSEPQLTAALRSDLGELVRSVTSKGMRIETWTPPESYPFPGTPGTGRGAAEPDGGAFHPDDPRQNRQDANPDDQRQKRGTRLEWLAELEERLGKD